MKLLYWLQAIACLAVIFAAYAVVDDTHEDERMVSCEIMQNGEVHVMPCRLVASYLAEVKL